MRKVLLLCLGWLLLTASTSPGQTAVRAQAAPEAPAPGTIKGRIFDAESGESMPYTNVFIVGTNIGTMAFTDGLML